VRAGIDTSRAVTTQTNGANRSAAASPIRPVSEIYESLAMPSDITTAVILAAGRGIRLAERGTEIPKGLLCLGGRSMVSDSLAHLAQAGIERVVIVTGHLAQFYVELARDAPLPIDLVYNAKYAESGTVYSLFCLRDRLKEPFLLLESDLIYESRALNELLQSPHENSLLLASIGDEADAVFVAADGDRVSGISKDARRLSAPVVGQYIGIAKLSSGLYAEICQWAETAFRTSLMYEYDQDCLSQLALVHEVCFCLVPDLIWAEVDTADDYRRASDLVYPRLINSRSPT
jgi:choline kinase